MARLCIFCGTPVDKGGMEHVIPKWIPKHLKQTHFILEHVQANNVTKREKVPFADYKAHIYCRACNEHFSRLEQKVRPHLIPMLDGVRIDHDEATQLVLAQWAMKTTTALLGVERKLRFVPKPQRVALRQHGKVPLSTFVGIGRYTAGGVRIFAGRARLTPGRGVPTDKILSVYHSVMAFGQVAFKVFGVLKPPPEETFRGPVGRLYRIWPPQQDTIDWPPLWGLDDDGIDELAVFNPFILR